MGIDRRGIMSAVGYALPLAVAVGVAVGTPAGAEPDRADHAADRQLRWLIGATRQAPVPAGELAAHLAAETLAAIGGADALNEVFAQIGPLTAGRSLASTATRAERLAVGAGRWVVRVDVEDTGLITSLKFAAYHETPRTWAELDRRARALAPNVSFAAARIGRGGDTTVVHGIAPDTRRPLGSAFKLYVLGALADEIAAGRASWREQLAIRDDWKSLPGGVLQDRPAGTELSLADFARYMISISDNTAADHLIHRVGRTRVEHELGRLGTADPAADLPFLTTRELFVLKGHDYPRLAAGYQRAPVPVRRARLARVDRVPLSAITPWTTPRRVNTLEWFATPADICRALAGLSDRYRVGGMAPLGTAMSTNDQYIGLDRRRFPLVWYKGGSEPGVLTVNFLAGTKRGEQVAASLLLSDPEQAFDETALLPEVLALARGGLELAARR
ncbi:serine hydrolase [Actinocatenispora sera]|uniref:serine hydrolase n=1 Tax=Actinocatenispora sera TaxID=390989 RepID=UPI0033C0C51E